jgi:hypothetical protein
LAALVAWLVFLVCINASIKAVNLFKRSSKWPFRSKLKQDNNNTKYSTII